VIAFVRDFFRVLGMPCREHTALFSQQLDGPLAPGIAFGLRFHVLYCTGCARFSAQIRRLQDLAARVGREDAGEQRMPRAVRERVAERLARGDKQS
jgi:hypothetical protein